MGQLSVKQYDALERAVNKQQRVMVMRRGTEYLVIPERLTLIKGREAIIARHVFANSPNLAAAARRLVRDGETTAEEAVRIMRSEAPTDA